MYAVQFGKMQKHINTHKNFLGCISMRAKLGIALSVIAAETFPLYLRQNAGLVLPILHKSYYLHH